MKKLIVVLLLMSAACQSNDKKNALPEGILSSEKMIPILADMHVAMASVKLKPMQQDSMNERIGYLYHHIYTSNQTTKKQFDESIDYYCKHPDVLNKIYEEVLNELSKKQAMQGKPMKSGK